MSDPLILYPIEFQIMWLFDMILYWLQERFIHRVLDVLFNIWKIYILCLFVYMCMYPNIHVTFMKDEDNAGTWEVEQLRLYNHTLYILKYSLNPSC